MGTNEDQEPQEIRVGLSAEERRKMYYQQMEQKNRQKILKQKRRRKRWRRFWHGKIPWLIGLALLLAAAVLIMFFVLRDGEENEERQAAVCYTDTGGSLYMEGLEYPLITGNHELLAADPSYSRFLILKNGNLCEVENGEEKQIAEQVDALDVFFDEQLNTVVYYKETDMAYRLYVWEREMEQSWELETDVPYLNTICVSRDGSRVAYAVQDQEGTHKIQIYSADSGQVSAAVEDSGYLSCYYVGETELIYYSLGQNRLYCLKGGSQSQLGQNVQDVMVFPEAERLIYRDTEADIKLVDYKNGTAISLGQAGEIYVSEQENSVRQPGISWRIEKMSRRSVVYGDVKELFLAGETSLISADIQTGETGVVLNGTAPDVMYLSGDGQRLYSLTGQTLVCTEKEEGKWRPDGSEQLSASCDSFTLAGESQSPVWLEGTDLYTQGAEAKELVADSVKKISDSRGGLGLAYLQGSSLYYLEEPGGEAALLTDGADVALAPAAGAGWIYYRAQDRSLRRISAAGKEDIIGEDVTEYYVIWTEKNSAG